MTLIKKWIVTRITELNNGQEDEFLPNFLIALLEEKVCSISASFFRSPLPSFLSHAETSIHESVYIHVCCNNPFVVQKDYSKMFLIFLFDFSFVPTFSFPSIFHFFLFSSPFSLFPFPSLSETVNPLGNFWQRNFLFSWNFFLFLFNPFFS